MINLTINAHDGNLYELTSRYNQPQASAARIHRSDIHSTQSLIARLSVEPDAWLQILARINYRPAALHSYHASAVHQEVAGAVMRGDLNIYQLPLLNSVRCLRGKKDIGLCIVQGPNPHSATELSPTPISNPQAAQALLDELGITASALLAYLDSNGLYNSYDQQKPLDEVFKRLAKQELLAYNIPLPPASAPKKSAEYVPATGPGYDPVPLAPEGSTSKFENPASAPAAKPIVTAKENIPESTLKASPTPPPNAPSPHPNTPQIKELMQKSPTLMNNLAALRSKGWLLEYGEEGGGSYANRNSTPKKIVIDQLELNDPKSFVQTLAHESGHAMYEPDQYIPPNGLSREQYVNANAAISLKDEGEATLVNMKIREEILANGGEDIGIAGTQQASYQKIYDEYKIHQDREAAREDIGYIFAMNERPSTDPTSTYKDYYSKPYENYWDKNVAKK